MFKQCVLSLSLAVLALALLRPVPAAAQGLDGTWTAADAQGTLARLVIASDAAGGITLQGFGQCGSGECDWGAVPLTTYGTSVSDAAASAGVALFNTRSSRTTVTVRSSGAGLQVDVFTRFADGSGRKNYFVHEEFNQPGRAIPPGTVTRAAYTRYNPSILAAIQPATGAVTKVPSAPTSGGQRTILPDGSVEITYADGTKKIYSENGVTTITPDGKSTYRAYSRFELAAQAPTPPSVPDAETKKWADQEASTLLTLIGALVAHDKTSLDNLVAKEAQMAWYERIDNRTRILQSLTTP